MTSLEDFPLEILDIINSFLPCACVSNSFYLLKKKFINFSKDKCNYISYKNLECCKFDSKNKDRIKVIETLCDCEKRVSLYGYLNSLHFLNNRQYKIAEPYLYNFGEVSHRSAARGSHGVIYKSTHSYGITSYGFTDTQEELIESLNDSI